MFIDKICSNKNIQRKYETCTCPHIIYHCKITLKKGANVRYDKETGAQGYTQQPGHVI